MHVLITGGSSFLGQKLARALMEINYNIKITLLDLVEPPKPSNFRPRANSITSPIDNVETVKLDITSASMVDSIFSKRYDTVYLMHGVMSAAAENDLELGQTVNIDSFRSILDWIRSKQPGTQVILPSSLAVYGPLEDGEVANEKTCPHPQSSYGAERLIIETLLQDYSRRGLIDGRIGRLPTVIVRPGSPTASASSFASSIVRDPLKGERAFLPVEEDFKLWICSPKAAIDNLILLGKLPQEKFGINRVVCFPGQTVTVGQIIDTLTSIAGDEKRAMIQKHHDPSNEAIVKSWPSSFDTTRAKQLGLEEDVSLRALIQLAAISLRTSQTM